MDDGKWVCQLAAEATGYLPTYNHALEEKVRVEPLVYKSHRKMKDSHLNLRELSFFLEFPVSVHWNNPPAVFQ